VPVREKREVSKRESGKALVWQTCVVLRVELCDIDALTYMASSSIFATRESITAFPHLGQGRVLYRLSRSALELLVT
jgi:hypothetical protein